jgi:hypothetical protein
LLRAILLSSQRLKSQSRLLLFRQKLLLLKKSRQKLQNKRKIP